MKNSMTLIKPKETPQPENTAGVLTQHCLNWHNLPIYVHPATSEIV